MMATSGLSFWTMGVYVHPLEQEFGWSRAETSAATSISFLVSGVMGPLSGWWWTARACGLRCSWERPASAWCFCS